LTDDDLNDYSEAAVRVGASRCAAEPALPVAGRPIRRTEPGAAGQTCLVLAAQGANATARRCTWGTVYAASAQADPQGRVVVVAVQPLATWRELWVLRRRGDAWSVDVLTPAAADPGLGYVEFAGFVPGTNKMLLAREAKVDGRFVRSFEVVALDTLVIEKRASTPSLLVAFGKWTDPAWKRTTVSLR
jgi:hypothetical protein